MTQSQGFSIIFIDF